MAERFDVFANTERDKERIRQRKDRVYEVSRKPLSELLVRPMFYMTIGFSALLFAAEIFTAMKASSDGYNAKWDPHNSFVSALVVWTVCGLITLWMIFSENRKTFKWLEEYPARYDEEVQPTSENGLTKSQAESLTAERRQRLELERNNKERYIEWLKRAMKILVTGEFILLLFSVVL